MTRAYPVDEDHYGQRRSMDHGSQAGRVHIQVEAVLRELFGASKLGQSALLEAASLVLRRFIRGVKGSVVPSAQQRGLGKAGAGRRNVATPYSGLRNRRSATGGLAYGMPKKIRASASTLPLTFPSFISTMSSAFSATCAALRATTVTASRLWRRWWLRRARRACGLT